MVQQPLTIIFFGSQAAANHLVGGVPAAARALWTIAGHCKDGRVLGVAVPGGWEPSAVCRSEAERGAPKLEWSAFDADEVATTRWISGALLQANVDDPESLAQSTRPELTPNDVDALRVEARAIIQRTGKPGDGLVSRYINRPISQAITSVLLKWSWPRPGHATAIAGLTGFAMLIALLFGGSLGLMLGAILFQCASIIDGVDGEMARATQRSSARGAMWDSVTDAATNLGFLAGVSINVWQQGLTLAALAGAIGFTSIALGTAILGREARRNSDTFTFDALKHRFRSKPSRVRQALTYITMRDFYALAACVAILAGAVVPLLFAFATIAVGWLVVVSSTFLRRA